MKSSRKSLACWNVYFYLFNLPLFWIMGCRYFYNSGIPHSVIGLVFVISAIIGHFAIFALLFIIIPSGIMTILFPKKYITITIAMLGALFALIYLSVDSTLFLSYRFHLNGIILQMIFSSAFNQIFSFSWFEWLLAALLVLVLISVECFLAWWLLNKTVKFIKHRYQTIGFCVIVVFYVLSHMIHAWCSAAYMYQGSAYAQSTINASQNLPLYYGMTTKNFLLGHGLITPIPNHNTQLANLSIKNKNSELHYPLHTINAQPITPKRNVILIVLDTWRADMMTKTTTPYIYQFAQQSWQFTNHYSGGDCTEPGIFSLFYGVPASFWPAFLATHRGPVLIDELLKQHYQLAIYASASLYKPDFYQTVFAKVPELHINNPQTQPWQRDQYINQEMIAFLKKQKQHKPFFGFLFYDSIHEYDFPPTFKTKFNPWWKTIDHLALTNNFNPTTYKNRYKNSVIYVDSLVHKILETLKQQHLMKNTVVIITADHGEEFNDNHKNYWGHASNFSHVQMQTPFIVYWPGKGAKIYQHFTSHYDLVPLLMQRVLGVSNPISDYSIGEPLLTPGNRGIIPVSSYVFNGFVERQSDRITTLIGGGLYRVTNDKLNPIKNERTNIKHLKTVFEMMHRYYK